jgi:hypothetical protein
MPIRKIFTKLECRKFGAELHRKIEENGLTITAAAMALGITRQCLHYHFLGKHQPRPRVVERAVRLWDMVVYAQGQKFDRRAFGPEITRRSPSVQLLLLGEAIERVDNANLEVSVVRKDASSLVLEVLVKFAG